MPRGVPITDETKGLWREDIANGLNKREIAEKHRVSYATVKRALIDCQPAPVSPEALANWEAALDEGYAHKHVAEMYGVPRARVRKHFPGRGWTPKQISEHASLMRRSRGLC